ncbi:transcription factor EGL1-like [Heracleum sosnowskyi]|uniref:Transcription factor EGL1-like n=1 Tax=Heracleum sosnowskyi TaxID=360622 RepID=A0AAD8LY53_9APIA|nr:transcription factor EGL1-like [Heracleum sosnowskyi]
MAGILRRQLALAVKNKQWSYAIFWSVSSTQNGALEWDDGYYNGDIKTRKTVQSEQLDADQLGLQRTEQLRELYESLLDAETNPQSARPSAALSPEDLTDTEWYFLVCMSFVFNIGECLPGRSLAKNQTIWLCNARYADSKVFSRTLLAKTVVCFPYSGGVIELGTTDLVSEDLSIIQHITSFLETPGTVVSNNSAYVPKTTRYGDHHNCAQPDENIIESKMNPDNEWKKLNTCSPNSSSEDFEPNCQANKSVTAKHEGASHVQSWQLMDDEISNGVLNSEDSSDCVSQTIASPEKSVPLQNEDKVKENHLLDHGDCKDTELTSVEVQNDDIHYQDGRKANYWVVTRLQAHENNGRGGKLKRPEADEIDENHVLAERRKREKMQEKFVILGTIVPSAGKVDNVSLLDDTIDYLRNLEKKVEKLESQKELQDIEAARRKRSCDVIESTSDNYGDKRVDQCKKQALKKRKASGITEVKAVRPFQQEDILTEDVTVSKTGKDITIEILCPSREDLFVEIMGATSNLHLDFHSVQSSNIDGNLSMTIKSKVNRSTPSAKIIRQALQRVTRKH